MALATFIRKMKSEQPKPPRLLNGNIISNILKLISNVFRIKDIDAAIEKGKHFPDSGNVYTQKSVGLDPGFGSSAFGICIIELRDGLVHVLHRRIYKA
jgi:hypothetical protein